MFSLIITLISIAVLAYAMSAGINYIDIDGVSSKKHAVQIEGAFFNVGLGMVTYKNLTKTFPTDVSQIIPSFARVSNLPKNVSFEAIGVDTLNSTPNIKFSCVNVSFANDVDYMSAVFLQKRHSDGQILLVNSCSDLVNSTNFDNSPESFNIKFYYK
jgi:hypothetical protein